MKQSYNSSQPKGTNELVAPDFSNQVSDFSWRPNLKTSQMELVRKRDGFVLDRMPMTLIQLERYGGDRMSKGINIDEFIGQKFGTLTIASAADPDPASRAKQVNVLCDCGVTKVVILSNLRAGLIKSCGHLRAKKADVARSPGSKEPEAEQREEQAPESVQTIARVEILPSDSTSTDFRTDLIETGKDISSLIRFAKKLDPMKVQTLLNEIDRVASSPFAAIPEGAREEAAAAQEFINRLQVIGV